MVGAVGFDARDVAYQQVYGNPFAKSCSNSKAQGLRKPAPRYTKPYAMKAEWGECV